MRIRIKVCGITRKQDAEAAVSLGVDALGFIFTRKSPRYVDPDFAAQLTVLVPPFVSRVGVFVDSDLDQVKHIVARAGLTQVQLHGKESAEYCRELRNWNRSLSICKAFLVGGQPMELDPALYRGAIDCVLFDTYLKGMDGGTGKTFDWDKIAELHVDVPLILAGGLTPDNVGEAIKRTLPYAVDVNSGVEDRPGVKNQQLLARLVAAVRHTEQEIGS